MHWAAFFYHRSAPLCPEVVTGLQNPKLRQAIHFDWNTNTSACQMAVCFCPYGAWVITDSGYELMVQGNRGACKIKVEWIVSLLIQKRECCIFGTVVEGPIPRLHNTSQSRIRKSLVEDLFHFQRMLLGPGWSPFRNLWIAFWLRVLVHEQLPP